MLVELNVRCGPRQFKATVNVEDHQSESSSTINNSIINLKTVGDLYQFIAAETNSDPARLKIIHKGKSISTDFEEPLRNYKFAATNNLMVMGARNCVPAAQTKAPEVDPGLQVLNEYEKKHLLKLNETYQSNTDEVTELERNFLEGDMAKEMIKRIDRRLQAFNETSIQHMENIDGLTIYDNKTSEEQKTRNCEKRKTLINGIQDLLNANDKLLFQLSQHRFRTEHPDEGH